MCLSIRELTEEEQRKLLTQDEVDNLSEGTDIMVKWSGGNGPHRYTISRAGGVAYARWGDQDLMPVCLFPVGQDRCQNRVWLATKRM